LSKWHNGALPIRNAMDEAGKMLTDEQAMFIPVLYRSWESDINYTVDDRRLYKGVLYKCLQPHIAQANWNPADTPSLWAKMLTSETGEILPWEQPDSTNGYKLGDKVTHNGETWECTGVDAGGNNIWEPGVYGWTVI